MCLLAALSGGRREVNVSYPCDEALQILSWKDSPAEMGFDELEVSYLIADQVREKWWQY